MNFDLTTDVIKDAADWRIVYDEFQKTYGNVNSDDNGEEYADENNNGESISVKNIYYNHIFSHDEITAIIDGLRTAKTVDNKTAEEIIAKIKSQLTSKYYRECSCRIYETIPVNRDCLRKNIHRIQDAIWNRHKIKFQFCYYNKDKNLVPSKHKKDTVSPYCIIEDSGKYYLAACSEGFESIRRLSIWRIDLMKDIAILERGGKPVSALPDKEIPDLQHIDSGDFGTLHMNMSYDEALVATIKINKRVHGNLTYTFIHDSFGDNFECIGNANDGIIKVRCSEFALVNWAMQYSDYVEVIEPSGVRESIRIKIAELQEKYKK